MPVGCAPGGEPVSATGAGREPVTVHEFLARVVTDPRAHRAFAEDPLGALRQAGFGGFDADQLWQVCSLVLDCVPADVVELYRGSVGPGLASCARPGRSVLASGSADHATEIASLRATPHPAPFGAEGDVDSGLLGAGRGVLPNGTEQVEAAAAGVPGLGGVVDRALPGHPVAEQAVVAGTAAPVPRPPGDLPAGQLPLAGPVVDHLPPPEPAPLAGALSHGSEQLGAAAGHLPVGPAVDHLPPLESESSHVSGFGSGYGVHGPGEGVPDDLPVVGPAVDQLPPLEPASNHLSGFDGYGVNESVEGVSDGLPVVGPAVDQLPPSEPASSHLSGFDGYAVNGPVGGVPDDLPVVGDLSGQLPLHG